MRLTSMSMLMPSRPQPNLLQYYKNIPHDLQPPGINQRQQLQQQQLDAVVVVMGATGTGKSRLSIDLAAHFPAAEIVNSDKMQLHRGLDIATNKITHEERRGVPHHLLGVIDPHADFTATNFCTVASAVTKSIIGRGKLPIIVGGSNSFLEALMMQEGGWRYNCCCLWVDVSIPVLHSFLSDRVDRMVEKGMVEEIREIFDPAIESDYSRGIRRSIGVPELDRFFRAQPALCDPETEARLLEEAIAEIKANTCKLACRQLDKIISLINVKGWKIHRVDATEALRRRGELAAEEADKAWENLVVVPSVKIVSRFLYNNNNYATTINSSTKSEAVRMGRRWLQLTR